MTAEETRLYTRYFYNSVIEFICFIFFYLEAHKSVSLDTLTKHIKFFKNEVSILISLFGGKTTEDKLYQMLNTLDCFSFSEKEIKIKRIKVKVRIFEDFVLSKCVDLLLKGSNDIDKICKNLNCSSIIAINKQDLLCIIGKCPYISISNNTVTLCHVHGLLGFEDFLCKSVIGYFYNILYHSKKLSFDEIRNHSKSLSFCGINNIIGIFAILNCSNQFDFQNGYAFIKSRSKKFPKKKPLSLEAIKTEFPSRALPIGQIVYGIYGSYLYQWSGEICTLNESLGIIYCAVDFTNGIQGVFKIYFGKTVLKVISEIDDLKRYLKIRDVVEFDAEYYSGKMVDRCWKATRVKLISSNKFQYNETLSDKLNYDTELRRSKCANSACNSRNGFIVSCIENVSVSDKDIKTEKKQILEEKSEPVNELKTVSTNTQDDSPSHGQEASNDLTVSVSNTVVLDYLFMFGFIYLTMKDKAAAIAKYKGDIYNILFLKESVYPPNESEHFLQKGQKILAFIPYLQNLESLCVATLVYGLNEEETNQSEHILPEEFAVKAFLLNNTKNLNKFCQNCSFMNGLQFESFITDLKYKIKLAELHDLITSQYKIPFESNELLLLLMNVCKRNINGIKFSTKVFNFIVKLSKYAKQEKLKMKKKRKLKSADVDQNFGSQVNILLQDIYVDTSQNGSPNSVKSDSSLTVKSKSLDGSFSSLSSYKTCRTDSSEFFYSCESKCNTPNDSSNSLDNGSLIATPNKESPPRQVNPIDEYELAAPLPTVLNDKCNILSINFSQELSQMKVPRYSKNDIKNSKCHNLSLQSIPTLKHSIKKKKKVILPYTLKRHCKNCGKNSLKVTATISLISRSFFFFTTNIDGHNVVLPLPKQTILQDLHGQLKLKSCCEITIIPSVLMNLSHILSARILSYSSVSKNTHLKM